MFSFILDKLTCFSTTQKVIVGCSNTSFLAEKLENILRKVVVLLLDWMKHLRLIPIAEYSTFKYFYNSKIVIIVY